MSVDRLQNQIRKLKNPSVVMFSLDKTQIPNKYLEIESDEIKAYCQYAKDLLEALNGIVPAVRFAFGSYALLGAKGVEALSQLLDLAKEQGFYVLLDAPEFYTPKDAELTANSLFENWKFDGLVVVCYLGSDGIKPFLKNLEDKALFVAARTGNKSASELQDLLTGSRLVHTAAADMIKRLGEGRIGKCGYSQIACFGPATSAESLRTLRSKNPTTFLLIDGFDYSGANAKNCSLAFDTLGHGAVACAGSSIVAAWTEEEGEAITLAVQAAERMKKNLARYIAIL